MVRTAAATSVWCSAGMCFTRSCCGPSTVPMRSQGLSVRSCMAMAQSMTALMRWRTRRAVSGRTCQMRRSVASTSALVTSHTGMRPMTREHVARQARQPVAGVLGIAPAAMLVGPDPLGGLGEGGHAPGALLLGQWVAAAACDLAFGDRQGARFLERDEREGAEAQLAPPAADDQPLDPAPRAARLDLQVEAVAVAVAPGACDVADEGRRERVFGMPPLGLVLGRACQ